MDIELSQKCQKDLLQYARKSIGKTLNLNDKPVFEEDCPVVSEKLGLFVTLTIDRKLRGCIGYIEGFKPVSESLSELAHSAAFGDPRFSPLSKEEFPGTNIEITLLSIPREIKEISEIQVGVHGLIITRGGNRGLLLPQVATEHKMDATQFIEATCNKAGLVKDSWQNRDTKIGIFEGYIFSDKED